VDILATHYLCTEMKKSTNSPNLKSVFANIVETRERKALYDVFIADSKTIGDGQNVPTGAIQFRSSFERWIDIYDQILNQSDFLMSLEKLKNLEISILMYRAMISPSITIGEMKLNRHGSEKSYAFVRAPFFAPDSVKNEIRVYLGTVEELGKSVEVLRMDSAFLDYCEEKVIDAMKQKLIEHRNKFDL
jgi:hypothetical protein